MEGNFVFTHLFSKSQNTSAVPSSYKEYLNQTCCCGRLLSDYPHIFIPICHIQTNIAFHILILATEVQRWKTIITFYSPSFSHNHWCNWIVNEYSSSFVDNKRINWMKERSFLHLEASRLRVGPFTNILPHHYRRCEYFSTRNPCLICKNIAPWHVIIYVRISSNLNLLGRIIR